MFLLFSLFFLLIAFCYWKAPRAIILKKKEYVMFFLWFGAGYLFLLGVSVIILEVLEILNWWEFKLVSILPFPLLCFVTHLLFPLKNTSKNLRQHVNFFLFFTMLLSMAIAGFFILLAFSNM